jgi:hypothetical protein
MMKHKLLLVIISIFLASEIQAQKYADCIKAKEICKKDTYTFEKLGGEGRDNFEAVPTPCFMGGIGTEDGNAEHNSAWIKFTVKESGSLKFTIKPLNRDDDMDFVVYRIDGGCDEKRILRCCASGDNHYPSPCMGTTGLRDGEDDIREEPGCINDNNSFLRPIKAKSGEVYVILVSNVTSKGPGFTIRIYGSCVLPCDDDKPKPEVAKVEKPKPEVQKTEAKPEPSTETPPVVVEIPKPTPPTEINGRKTVVNKTLAVKSRNITLKVWDSSIEDGDVVSIYVNGKKKFANIELKNKPQEFILDLEPGENYITAHAENFGRKEPNTAALSVFDGKKEQKLSLNATKTSEESLKVTVE